MAEEFILEVKLSALLLAVDCRSRNSTGRECVYPSLTSYLANIIIGIVATQENVWYKVLVQKIGEFLCMIITNKD